MKTEYESYWNSLEMELMALQELLLLSDALDNNLTLKAEITKILGKELQKAQDYKDKDPVRTKAHLTSIYAGFKGIWGALMRELKTSDKKDAVKDKILRCYKKIEAIKALIDTNTYSRAA